MSANNVSSKVAAIQMCSTHNVDKNLATAETLIREASSKGAKLIVLPENFAFMGLKPTDKLSIRETYGQGKIQEFLSKTAQENQIWLVGGTIPITCKHGDRVRAACLLYNDKGDVVARYDKIHLFDAKVSDAEVHQESSVIEPGNEIVAVDTPFGRLGLTVCFDLRFVNQFYALVNFGAEIIAVPSAFTQPTGLAHWEILLRCRAIDTFSYIIGAGQGGTHTNGRKTFGHSMIINPWAQILAKKEDITPGVIDAEISLNYLHEVRKSIPVTAQ